MNFHANIVMDSNTKWNRTYFMNVMIHELGHALGIPHIQTDIMQSHGFGCDDYEDINICTLQDFDFEKFLWPYIPKGTITIANQEARKKAKREAEFENMKPWHYSFTGCSPQGLCP